jgi:hypothetical protein
MKIDEFKAGRAQFRAAKDEKVVAKIVAIVAEFNKVGEMPSTRQISNVFHGTQTVAEAVKGTDTSMPTTGQDALLQGILNPLQAAKKLVACYGERNQKYWKLQDEVVARLAKAEK